MKCFVILVAGKFRPFSIKSVPQLIFLLTPLKVQYIPNTFFSGNIDKSEPTAGPALLNGLNQVNPMGVFKNNHYENSKYLFLKKFAHFYEDPRGNFLCNVIKTFQNFSIYHILKDIPALPTSQVYRKIQNASKNLKIERIIAFDKYLHKLFFAFYFHLSKNLFLTLKNNEVADLTHFSTKRGCF